MDLAILRRPNGWPPPPPLDSENSPGRWVTDRTEVWMGRAGEEKEVLFRFAHRVLCLTWDGERITCRSSSRYTRAHGHTRAHTSFIGSHLNSWPGACLNAMHSKRPERTQNATKCVGILLLLLLLLLGGGREVGRATTTGPETSCPNKHARVSIMRVNIRKTLFYLAAAVRVPPRPFTATSLPQRRYVDDDLVVRSRPFRERFPTVSPLCFASNVRASTDGRNTIERTSRDAYRVRRDNRSFLFFCGVLKNTRICARH